MGRAQHLALEPGWRHAQAASAEAGDALSKAIMAWWFALQIRLARDVSPGLFQRRRLCYSASATAVSASCQPVSWELGSRGRREQE
jgi:hypothetical protein